MNTQLAQTRSGPLRYTDPAAITAGVTRGVCRWLGDLGYAALTEFKLGNGRRADVAGLSPDGRIVMIEVKSTVQDFRADDKWLDYVPYCDGFPLPYPAIFHSKFYLRPVAFWSPTITGQRLFGQP